MVFNFILFFVSSSCLTLQIHLYMLVLFLHSLINSSCLTSKVSLTLRLQVEYNELNVPIPFGVVGVVLVSLLLTLKHISHIVLVFILLALSSQMLAGIKIIF